MQEVDWHPVKPESFKEGTVVFKEPAFLNRRDNMVTVGKFKGKCDKGLHFGSACFDRISTWWIPEKNSNAKRSQKASA